MPPRIVIGDWEGAYLFATEGLRLGYPSSAVITSKMSFPLCYRGRLQK